MSRSIRLLLAVITAAFTLAVMVLIVVPLKAVDVGLPASTAVALVAAWGLLGLIADIPGSALSDAIGRRAVIASGGIATVASAVILMLASDLPGMLVGMVLFGFGQAFTFGPALAFLTEVTPDGEHARVQGLNGALQGIGSIVGALVAGVAVGVGFECAFIGVMILSVVVIGAALGADESIDRRAHGSLGRQLARSYGQALRMTVRRPGVTFASSTSVLYSITFLIVAASIVPLVLVEIEGYGPVLVGALLAFRNLVSALTSLTFASAVRRFGLTRMVVRLSWLATLGTALLAFATGSPWLLLIPLILQAIGMAYGAAASNILVMRATSVDERATGMAATTVASRLTVLIVPLLLAPLITPSTASGAFLLAAALSVPVVVVLQAMGRRLDRQAMNASVVSERV